jgi:hypothetical protein
VTVSGGEKRSVIPLLVKNGANVNITVCRMDSHLSGVCTKAFRTPTNTGAQPPLVFGCKVQTQAYQKGMAPKEIKQRLCCLEIAYAHHLERVSTIPLHILLSG